MLVTIKREIPSSGEALPVLGMGCWGIGGRVDGNASYGATDDGTSLSTVRQARRQGVRFLDVAPAYGNGHAETLVGIGAKEAGDPCFTATKYGRTRFNTPHDYSKKSAQESLNLSLERLQRDQIDLVQMHDPLPELLEDAKTLSILRGLKEEGVARYVGVSCRAPEHALILVENQAVDFVQVNYNLMDQRARECGLLDAAQGKVAVIARTPLCFGFLSGTLPDRPHFGHGDHRNNWPPAQITRWIEGTRDFAKRIGEKAGISSLSLALRFCLSHPAVTVVLPGMMRPEEVDMNVDAIQEGALDDPLLAEIYQFYQSTEFFLPR